MSDEDVRESTAATPRASRLIELEQLLQLSVEQGQDVALFSLEDLQKLLIDLIRQKILSINHSFMVSLRF